MIMLGGRYCDAYLGNVQDALTKVAGVKTVGTPVTSAFPPGVGNAKPVIFGTR